MRRLLLLLGAPMWLPLTVALIAVIFSLLVASWAVFASLLSVGGFAIVAGISRVFNANVLGGLISTGAGLIICGLAILTFLLCAALSKRMMSFIKRMSFGILGCFK
jgi:uncharacterized membrane protein